MIDAAWLLLIVPASVFIGFMFAALVISGSDRREIP